MNKSYSMLEILNQVKNLHGRPSVIIDQLEKIQAQIPDLIPMILDWDPSAEYIRAKQSAAIIEAVRAVGPSNKNAEARLLGYAKRLKEGTL